MNTHDFGSCPKCRAFYRSVKWRRGNLDMGTRERLLITCERCGYVEERPPLDSALKVEKAP